MNWESAIPNVLTGDASGVAAAPACTSMDSEGFAAFYERSARPLWAYLARVSGNAALADDLLQESFMRFLCADHPKTAKSAPGDISSASPPTCCAITGAGRRARPSKTSPPNCSRPGITPRHPTPRTMLGPALKTMRPRERQLLWLAYAEGYSHREIAEITGLASASIRLLLFRARRKIARLLTDDRRVP